MLIAGEPVRGSGKPINAFDPATGETLEPAYRYGDSSKVEADYPEAAQLLPVLDHLWRPIDGQFTAD